MITTFVAVVLATVGFAFFMVAPQKLFIGSAGCAAVLIVLVGASLGLVLSGCSLY